MRDSQHILLVEGQADCSFFTELCRTLDLDTIVSVAPPKLLGGGQNNKQGVFNYLPTLLKQLNDNENARFAIVVDADLTRDGGGVATAIQQVILRIQDSGFTSPPTGGLNQGFLFAHNDGLPDFGMWVMPNNQDEGMLENWISQCKHPTEQVLFSLAQTAVATLQDPKFNAHRITKAEVATWLAWQRKPGEGLYYTVKDHLLDENSPLYAGLCTWLRQVFL